jgi:2-polyprenyl-6-methoxyphenol hydroxylase-like FAD-dependent oxidoreductase
MSQNKVDVLVVGAGPVGLFCANELMRHGLTCRIIDKKSTISDKSKALGIHIRTLDVLEDCGLIDEILKQGHRVDEIFLKSKGKTLINANFSGITANRHYLIDLPQNQTESILYQNLQDKGLQVEWETELTQLSQAPNQITATLQKPNNKSESFSAKWLIACDGAHSTVRHQVNADFKGSAYKQEWWLADLLVDWQVPESRMAMYINERGPMACFPMGNKRYRIVMTAPEGSTTDPSLEEIALEFKRRSTDPAVLSHPIWISQFSIHHRQIQQYQYDRVFFAGDAAHIHSPMGGQGLNTGMQDVYNLVWKLALTEKGQAKPELLKTYHEERFPVGHQVLKKTDLMTRMILIKNPLLVFLRNHFIRFMTSFTPIKNFMIKDLAELSISYAKSSIVHHSGHIKSLKAGDYLPPFELWDPVTQQQINSTLLTQGIQHHLFIFNGLNTDASLPLISLANSLAEKYPDSLKVHLVMPEKSALPSGTFNVLIDKQQHVHQHFKLTESALILIRPDKYIGIAQMPINKNALLDELYL